ncbi:hypothetical protein PGB90_008487 [Kerria lacca]
MCALAEPASKCEQRAVVHFLLLEKQTPASIAKRLKAIYGDKALSRVHVWKWCKRFQEGRTNLHDEDRSGRPSIITDQLVNSIQEYILNDHRLTISDLCNFYSDLSTGTMFDIVHGCLGYRKICARWVPKELSSSNARSHTSRVTTKLLKSFKWDVFPHPLHSLHLAPSDYHLFLHLKRYLGGITFSNNDELRATVTEYFANLEASHYEEGISKLVQRYDKCLNRYGDYVEK